MFVLSRMVLVIGVLTALAASAPEAGADDGPSTETATFSMYCYWTGEATLGRVEGVVASRIGHWGRGEIVEVDYDPDQTDIGELVQALKSRRSFYAVTVGGDEGRLEARKFVAANDIRELSGSPRFIESKYSLRRRHPELYALDLTESQAIALNSWSYFGGRMPDVLTADQKRRVSSR